jgi:hypothetical protein
VLALLTQALGHAENEKAYGSTFITALKKYFIFGQVR